MAALLYFRWEWWEGTLVEFDLRRVAVVVNASTIDRSRIVVELAGNREPGRFPPERRRPVSLADEEPLAVASEAEIVIRPQVARAVRQNLRALPSERSNREQRGAPMVPVFVNLERGLRASLTQTELARILDEMRRRIERTVGEFGAGRIAVALHRPRRAPAQPVHGAISILGVGTAGFRATLDGVAIDPWGVCEWHHAGNGIQAQGVLNGPSRIDIVVGSHEELSRVQHGRAALSIVGATTDDPPHLALGRSVIFTTEGLLGVQLASVIDGITNDRPLHDALWRDSIGRGTGFLASSPEAVHDLRIADIWGHVVRRGQELEGRTGHLATQALDLTGYRADLQNALEQSFTIDRDYGADPGEGHLVLEASQALNLAQDQWEAIEATGTSTPPRRVASLMVRRSGHEPIDAASTLYVGPHTVLDRTKTYVLDVQIGARTRNSLVTGIEQPIDELLPDRSRGHDIDVHVIPISTVSEQPITETVHRVLHLPPRGATDLVAFPLSFEAFDAERSSGEYRVLLVHEGFLVQTFRLTVGLANGEEETARDVTFARLEFSATAKWSNLDSLRPRDITLTLNDSNGTHHLSVSREDEGVGITLSELLTTDILKEVRAALATVTLAPQPLLEHIRDLAIIGYRNLYKPIDLRLPESLSKKLEPLRNGEGTILVVRVDPNYVVPWHLVYDWDLPPEDAPVCLGRVGDDPCQHDPSSATAYCVRGFWGYRHVIEDQYRPDEPDHQGDLPTTVHPIDGTPRLALDIGTRDSVTGSMVKVLAQNLPDWVLVGPGFDLADGLFDPSRPGALTVVGHTDRVAGVERIESGSADRWLTDDAIFQRTPKTGIPWDDPRTICLLMGCATGNVEPRTPVGFVATLAKAGAAAVVVTESPIDTEVACSAALDILEVLFSPSPEFPEPTIGEAIRHARRQHLEKGHANILTVSTYGSADARVA